MRDRPKLLLMGDRRGLLLWGATGQAKVLAELARGSDLELVALVDRAVERSPFPDVPLLAGADELDAWLAERDSAVLVAGVAVGGARGRERLALQAEFERRGLEIGTFIHRAAFVADDADVGRGSQILAGACLATHARLGAAVIVNTAASVDHDCVIGDGAHIGPGARLAGEVTVGDCAFIATGATVIPRITIGADAVVGAGAVVIRPVPAGAIVAGNPARQIGTTGG